MADQALFAYQAQLPDGSTVVRTGGADTPPTHQQLADYAANQGERYLGPVPMSPNVATGPPEEAAPAPAAPAVPPVQAGAVPSPDTFGQRVYRTMLPERSLMSQVPSMVGGFGGGVLGGAAAGALGGPLAPITIPLGAIAGGVLGSGGLEYLQAKSEQESGVEPSEAGTPMERATRAAIRGGVGEGAAQGLSAGAQAVKAAAGPTLRAAETLAPTLTRELPAEATSATTKVGQLIRDPAALAGAELTPQGQQTVMSAWWQHHAADGPSAIVNAWDALGAQGQSVLAGEHVDAMSTLVNSMRGGKPLMQTTIADVLGQGGIPTALWHYGMVPKEAAIALGLGTKLAREQAPKLLARPTVLDWMSRLPQISRVASPWAMAGTEAAGQVGAREVLP